MKQIKFRAKIAATDVWIYGLPYAVYSDNDIDSIQSIETKQVEYIKTNTLGQFIGRNDKNGIEIFTGDILPAADGFGLLPVCFNYDKFSLYLKGYGNVDYDWNDFEIKGNIFDNPELLQDVV